MKHTELIMLLYKKYMHSKTRIVVENFLEKIINVFENNPLTNFVKSFVIEFLIFWGFDTGNKLYLIADDGKYVGNDFIVRYNDKKLKAFIYHLFNKRYYVESMYSLYYKNDNYTYAYDFSKMNAFERWFIKSNMELDHKTTFKYKKFMLLDFHNMINV